VIDRATQAAQRLYCALAASPNGIDAIDYVGQILGIGRGASSHVKPCGSAVGPVVVGRDLEQNASCIGRHVPRPAAVPDFRAGGAELHRSAGFDSVQGVGCRQVAMAVDFDAAPGSPLMPGWRGLPASRPAH